jgi:hypothetical protein
VSPELESKMSDKGETGINWTAISVIIAILALIATWIGINKTIYFGKMQIEPSIEFSLDYSRMNLIMRNLSDDSVVSVCLEEEAAVYRSGDGTGSGKPFYTYDRTIGSLAGQLRSGDTCTVAVGGLVKGIVADYKQNLEIYENSALKGRSFQSGPAIVTFYMSYYGKVGMKPFTKSATALLEGVNNGLPSLGDPEGSRVEAHGGKYSEWLCRMSGNKPGSLSYRSELYPEVPMRLPTQPGAVVGLFLFQVGPPPIRCTSH